MGQEPTRTDQETHWDTVYASSEDFFGPDASECAQRAMDRFRDEEAETVLELGFGQGRDTLYFARSGLQVTALDYSTTAVEEVTRKAREQGLAPLIQAQTHDVRQPLPFPDNHFDACYSHMLLCMELRTKEIAFILREIHRVLKPQGHAVYSVRSTHDKHYGTGVHMKEDLYELGGFIIHFFSEEKIRRLARGYDLLQLDRIEEGSLPRDLYVVSLRKDPDVVPSVDEEQESTAEPMAKFQEFFDATYGTGVLDKKTKNLIGLSASLAAGCDT